MTLPTTGLEVQTYEELLDSIIADEQELISSTINVNEDTLLGQLNIIMASRLALANEGLQDVYDQRNINVAEGKALDDAVSWMGIQRQGAVATAGEQYFVGSDGTIIAGGSMVRNAGSGDTFTVDTALTISKSACRKIKIGVTTVSNSTAYSPVVNGTTYTYTSDGNATAQEIVTGLVAAITAATNITAVDNGNETFTVSTDDHTDFTYVNDVKLNIVEITSAGDITCTETGIIQAPSLSVDTIITPVSGWTSTYNRLALTSGREVETDVELRERAKLTRTSSGKATVDSIKAAVLNVAGVSSITVNEQYVSMGDNINGQPMGSIQLTIQGGTSDNEVAQAIWDSKPAGVEVWAIPDASLASGTATDVAGSTHTMEWNRPTAYPMTILVTYYVFDTDSYPATDAEAEDAIAAAVLAFGNSLGSGEDVYASEFEGSVYGAVGGIYRVYIEIADKAVPTTNCDSAANDFITVAASEEAYFELADITVTKLS